MKQSLQDLNEKHGPIVSTEFMVDLDSLSR
jgi:hypothetical protein